VARRFDHVLAALLALWAAASVLPVAAWTGVVPVSVYGDAWGLWATSALVAVLGTALALVLTRGAIGGWLRRAGRRCLRVPAPVFVAVAGAVAAAEAIAVAVWCFARNPQSVDAWVQYFQARIFLSGSLVAPAPPSIAHFATLHAAIDEHGWFSHFPPVHPALLAVGLAAGAAWLVTPVLAALLPWAVHRLGRRTGDERIARTAAALVCCSPFVAAMDASAMNHLPAALVVALALAAALDVARTGPRAAAAFGALVGLGLGLRPLDAALLGAVGAPLVVAGGLRACVAGAAAGAVALLPTLAYNAATTGDPLTFTYAAVWGDGLRLGLGHAVPWGEALTLGRAVGNTAADAHRLNIHLLEWPLPVTALAAAGLAAARPAARPALRSAAGYLLLLVGALFFYFHRDTLYGPRFLFSAVPPLVVLVAAGLVRLTEGERNVGWRELRAGDLALAALVAMAAVSVLQLAPRRLATYAVGGTALAVHPGADAARAGIARGIVLVPEGWGARLIARLWASGIPMRDSDRWYHALDACALEEALAAAEADGARGAALVARLEAAARGGPGRPAPGVTPDPQLRLPADGRLTPRCAGEVTRDQRLPVQFAQHLHLNHPRLDGGLVWARELGASDVELLRLFPGRDLYRYAVARGAAHGTFERLAAAVPATPVASARPER
jgi:hypothetical protein